MAMAFYPEDHEENIIRVARYIDEYYLTIGTTGADAVVDCMADLVSGRLVVSEWETDDETVFRAIALVAMKLQHQGELHKMIGLDPVA